MSGSNAHRAFRGWRRGCAPAVCIALLLLPAGCPVWSADAAPPVPTVGIVTFDTVTPVPPVSGLVAERFAADDLSAMLARAANDRFRVIPRSAVQEAQRDIGWRAGDIIRYERMAKLARRLGADRLVVGSIRQLSNSTDDVADGGGPILGSADVTVQVFDAAQGRIITNARGHGEAIGVVRPVVTEQVLHRALAVTLDSIAPALIGGRRPGALSMTASRPNASSHMLSRQ